ncbi:cytochrome c peroxidase [Janthinobacterium sp. LB2P49]|uniref:cytochrome c peroxidase n=1 Tax=Janthinobacterium sp. LB2P49 TaxID=3424198 RepID=UPI003F2956F8
MLACTACQVRLPNSALPAQLGRRTFHDASLSASGTQSCASCHDPARAHALGNKLAIQLGGADGQAHGYRATPSLRYLEHNPPFRFDEEGAPNGGINRDGRAASLAEQAERPLLAAHEIANATSEEKCRNSMTCPPGTTPT